MLLTPQPAAEFLSIPDFGKMLDEHLIRRVRDEAERLAQLLRQQGAALEHDVLPLIDRADLPTWQSLGKLSYNATRSALGAMIGATAWGMHVMAGEYELTLPILDGQIQLASAI